MVSMSGPSTSIQGTTEAQPIDGNTLNELISSGKEVCILDCRTRGSSLKNSTRVRLPHVLLRRLQSGSLPLTNISSRLVDDGVIVVVIPEEEPTQGAQSKDVLNALKKQGKQTLFLLADGVESVLDQFPKLKECQMMESNMMMNPPSPKKKGEDLRSLNLDALRIENDIEGPGLNLTPMPKTNDKRQTFPVQILPHLYLGNAETAENKELLDSYGIHYIINVTSNLDNFFEDDSRFHYLRISVDDNAAYNLTQFFPQAIDFIDEAERENEGCLVHCLAGISRSVTICLAYLMFTRKWSLEEAYDVVLGRNASIAPNFHFMGQLSDYERFLGIQPKKGSASLSPCCGAEASSAARPPSACLTPPPTSFPKNEKRHFDE
ncbi:unnamed protein product, partial [Mesorhabditis belari]|uniref:Protein-tyrosine-phosphatase n=1 Tax=Mesorhabditis belari TaxID=2138241 RepID=A0AAF3EZ54_9BILA